MANVIHFFEYLEFEDLEKLDITYKDPVKGENMTYIAKLEQPVKFYLPKSEVIDIYQDDFGRNIGSYLINISEHVELLTFIENFDSLCIDHASLYSETWFKKKLTSKILVKYYNSIYCLDDEEDDNVEQITIDFEVNNRDLLNRLKDYNNSDTLNLVVSIESIEFFKQTFKWKIILDSIVDGIHDCTDESEGSEIDFSTVMHDSVENSDNICDKENTECNDDPEAKENNNEDDAVHEEDTIVNSNEEKDPLDETSNDDSESKKSIQEECENTNKENEEIKEETMDSKDIVIEKEENVEIKEETMDSKDIVIEKEENVEKKEETMDSKNTVIENRESVEKTVENLVRDSVEDRESNNRGENNVEINSESKKSIKENNQEGLEGGYLEKESVKDDNKNTGSDYVDEKASFSQSVKINDEVISELADTENLKNTESENQNRIEETKSSSNNSLDSSKIDTKTLLEIETIINDKRIEARKYLLNAERAKKASMALSEKAAIVSKEVLNFEEKLRNLSESSVL